MNFFYIFLSFLLTFFSFSAKIQANDNYKILIGSVLNQNPKILKEFLDSLTRLKKDFFMVDYFFIESENTKNYKHLLKDFKKEKNCLIIPAHDFFQFPIDNTQHDDQISWKTAEFYDQIIEKAITDNYDYLFLVDSNIILHPNTINQLIKTNKDIVSNIFWTYLNESKNIFPQVWMSDEYQLYKTEIDEKLNEEEINKKTAFFLNMLKKPGIYEVGGLRSCTLIKKTALKKGVSFKKLSNLSLGGPDMHFCIRALSLGFSLFVDTNNPAYCMIQDSDLDDIDNFKKRCEINVPRLTLSMIVKNEANRYLRQVLEKAKEYITDAIIIDDGSSDNTPSICLEVLKGIPVHLVINNTSKFSNEIELRKQQWEETIKTNPDWILLLDADQIFEDSFKDKVKDLITSNDFDAYYFRIYDFWDDSHYRDDKYWLGAKYYYLKLARYIPNLKYEWQEKSHHCTSFPHTIKQFKKGYSNLRLKHFGWAVYEDRIAKYRRYQMLDPGAKFGWKEQYDSILDLYPNTVLWNE